MKILVAHAPAGSGHLKAAEAIVGAFQRLDPSVEVALLNALDGASAWYRFCFTQGYLKVIRWAPFLWWLGYHLTDWAGWRPLVHALHRISNRIHAGGLLHLLEKEEPQAVIATHFLPLEVAAHWKSSKNRAARIIGVITDYLPHTLWTAPGVDEYVVGVESAKEELMKRGVEAFRIHVLGIPINLKFRRPVGRSLLQERLGVAQGKLTVLIGSGGSGTGPILDLVKRLARIQGPLQLIVVAGHNHRLFRQLEDTRLNISHPMKVLGFVDNMEEWMEVSDLMITKPGGLSCAEAMAKGLPLVLVAPIPGQEARNARLLATMQVAALARNLSEAARMVEDSLQEPERLRAESEKAKAASRPEAALQIAQLVL